MANTYYLISKDIGKKFHRYKGDALRLSTQIPYTVDEVVIGVKGKIGQESIITTFRDSKGQIIERAFDYYKKPFKNMVYTRQDHIIGKENFVTTTTIKEYSLKRSFLNAYNNLKDFGRTILWDQKKIETNHLCENINNGEKILSRVSVSNLEHPTKQKHSYTEFPHIINGKKSGNSKKHFEFIFNLIQDKINPDGIIENGVKIYKNDSFLPYRSYDMESIKEIVTHLFLKKLGLTNKNIKIETNYQPQNEKEEKTLSAFFSWFDGSINFNKYYTFKSKSNLINTIRHEVEHAWQAYLDARNNKGTRTDWGKDIFEKFGGIRKKHLKKEAEAYTVSIDNYISYDEDFQRYKKNYIEILAERAGLNIQKQYDKEGKSLREAFPFIPKELL